MRGIVADEEEEDEVVVMVVVTTGSEWMDAGGGNSMPVMGSGDHERDAFERTRMPFSRQWTTVYDGINDEEGGAAAYEDEGSRRS